MPPFEVTWSHEDGAVSTEIVDDAPTKGTVEHYTVGRETFKQVHEVLDLETNSAAVTSPDPDADNPAVESGALILPDDSDQPNHGVVDYNASYGSLQSQADAEAAVEDGNPPPETEVPDSPEVQTSPADDTSLIVGGESTSEQPSS